MSVFNSIPVKVLHDAVGTTISLELGNGEIYTGTLKEVEENMNVMLSDAKKVSRSGKETAMPSVFLRGANIVFFQLPDALQVSPTLLAAGEITTKSSDARGDGKGFGAANRKRARD